MKKEAILFIAVFLAISIVSASSKISCSDNSLPILDQREIGLGDSRAVNEVGIALIKETESAFYKRISADLIIDSRRVVLSNQTASEDIELLKGKYTIDLVEINESSVTIKIDGESATTSLLETATAKGLIAMLGNLDLSEEVPKAKIVVGSKQISLSTDKNPAEKVAFGNKTYLIELISGSQVDVLVSVSKCKTGEISYANETKTSQNESNQTQETNNQTIENIKNNETKDNETQDTAQVTVADANAKNNKTVKESNNSADTIVEKQDEKKGFFTRIWDWIKGLFGGKK